MPARTQYDHYIDGASGAISPCQYCRRLQALGRGPRPGEGIPELVAESSCQAFPAGIPWRIHRPGGHDHSRPYPGDHGLRFVPETPTLVLDLLTYNVVWPGAPELRLALPAPT